MPFPIPTDPQEFLRQAVQQRLQRADLDREARAQGFPSHQAMVSFYRHRSNPTATTGRRSPSLQQAQDATIIHPRRLFEYISDKFQRATGQ